MSAYIPETRENQQTMLEFLGCGSARDLFADVPDELMLDSLNLPEAMPEMALRQKMESLAEQNIRYSSVFRGAGAYRHYIPSIVRQVAAKESFVTAYTPYQAEISQGILQVIFEYQTEMCLLSGMDVSNASLYDGASAAAEAVAMCRERNRTKALVAQTVHPDLLEVVKTYSHSAGAPVEAVSAQDGTINLAELEAKLDETTACVVVQSPNYLGQLEDTRAIASLCQQHGVKFIYSFNPIAVALLETPAQVGADIAVAEGQPLGMPLSFGGPYLGVIACKKDMMRRLPGRIVGETKDAAGKRCYVLTLQAREQHIRREKAGSSICSNQALCALTATVYLAAMGPDGMRKAAEQCYSKAHYLAGQLAQAGFKRVHEGDFFHEFVTTCPANKELLMARLEQAGILGGLPVKDGILWCCTERNSKHEMDSLVSLCREVAK